eukprot:2951375-Amphidinium_carterae.1
MLHGSVRQNLSLQLFQEGDSTNTASKLLGTSSMENPGCNLTKLQQNGKISSNLRQSLKTHARSIPYANGLRDFVQASHKLVGCCQGCQKIPQQGVVG